MPPKEDIYLVKDDFFDYFHDEEVVFEYDGNEEEEVIFDYPHKHQEMAAAINDQPNDKFHENTFGFCSNQSHKEFC